MLSKIISAIVFAFFAIAAMGWIAFNFAIGWAILKSVFHFIVG